ncbi:MAG: glycosyltransferase family 4 protein [Candidatus Saccharimonadales bacterium]
MNTKIRVNMVSESDISVQGHGVHTAYEEIATALEKRDDVTVIRGKFGELVDCDIVHLHTIGTQTWRKLFQRGPKKVISAHVVPASLVGSIVLAKYWLWAAHLYMMWFYNRADKVLAVSGTVARVLHDELRVPLRKIETFYNTIDMQIYASTPETKAACRDKLGLAADQFIVLGNGQVQQRKRVDVFVKMAMALPDVTFIWIGGIPFKQLGADFAKMDALMKNGPANLIMTGIIDHDDVHDYVVASDVFCLPAEQENHPMCVLEAAGAGLPIILRDIPEYDDTFGDDVIRCQDETFVDAIVKLQADATFYQQQKQRTKAIAARFDSNAAAEKLVKLYRQLI